MEHNCDIATNDGALSVLFWWCGVVAPSGRTVMSGASSAANGHYGLADKDDKERLREWLVAMITMSTRR